MPESKAEHTARVEHAAKRYARDEGISIRQLHVIACEHYFATAARSASEPDKPRSSMPTWNNHDEYELVVAVAENA